jgi:hypothetical protein
MHFNTKKLSELRKKNYNKNNQIDYINSNNIQDFCNFSQNEYLNFYFLINRTQKI